MTNSIRIAILAPLAFTALHTHGRDYTTVIQDYLSATGGRKDKILLGISLDRGGTEWRCRSEQPLSPIYPLIDKPRRITAEQARANAARHGRRFAPQQQEPWYCYREGDRFVQGWYEDEESFAAKPDLARRFNLQGVCLWVLDGAKKSSEDYRLIRERLRGNVPQGRPGDCGRQESGTRREHLLQSSEQSQVVWESP